MTDPASLTFFFPYREVSGVPVLFERMARQVAAAHSVRVRVVDYEDGYQARALNGAAGVEVVPFRDGAPMELSPDTVLVMQAILPATIRAELRPHPDTRVFFWTLHPLNLVQTLLPHDRFRDVQTRRIGLNRLILDTVLRGHRDVMRRVVRAMHDRGALVFMDGTTLESTTARLGLELCDPVFLPVPVGKGVLPRRTCPRSGRPPGLSFAWLGRLADFKIHILTYTIERLSAWARTSRTPVTMHVIGDGPEAPAVGRLRVEHEHFRLMMAGVRSGAALDEYLVAHVDVLAAMGTSALEGARLGIPTVLLDVAYGPLRGDYKFKWLFEADRFSLGDMVGARSFQQGNRSLERIIEAITGAYQSVADRTYEYCMRHHALDGVAVRFLEAVRRSSFRYCDFPREALRKTLVRRTYEWVRALNGERWSGRV